MKQNQTLQIVRKPSKAGLFKDVSSLIDDSREKLSGIYNSELTILYWRTGRLIREHILRHQRAGYGEKVIAGLSEKLTVRYGRGWSKSQLWNCLHAVERIPSEKILYTLCRELSWSHIRVLIYIKDDLQREFYTRMCVHEKWDVRQLGQKIDTMLFERTALSRKPEKLIRQELKLLKAKGPASDDLIFRDPVLLDFLGLQDVYSEKDLESAIVVELQKFIIELGTDFAFVARQKRLTIDGVDYFIDLLFYHRRMRRLVAIDLKLEKFKAEHKGQMELYLRWLERYEVREGENEPVGLILCADKSQEHVELLMLNDQRIKVAKYLTELPPKELLRKRLHQAVEIASRKHTAQRQLTEGIKPGTKKASKKKTDAAVGKASARQKR